MEICGEFLFWSNIFQHLYPGATQVRGLGEVNHGLPWKPHELRTFS